MKTNNIVALLMLGVIALSNPSACAEDKLEDKEFHGCFLYRDTAGKVWIAQPLVSLGMIGVMGGPPKYHLSPELAKQFAPLVNELKEVPDTPAYWWWDLPAPAKPEVPVILVRLETKAAQIGSEEPDDIQTDLGLRVIGGSSKIYEIRSAKLIYAEFISANWRSAWKSLDAGLSEIASASRTVPSKKKTQRLTLAIESASKALNTMTAEKVSDATRELVRKIEPKAACTRLFQSQVEGAGIGDWGGQLREFIRTLQIEPKTKLHQAHKPCPKVELLAKSSAPDEYLATIKKSWSPDTLYEPLIYSKNLERAVFVWQVEDFSPDQFASLKREAQAELDRRAAAAETAASQVQAPAPKNQAFELSEWGVTLRKADPDLLAEKRVLRGVLVKGVVDTGSDAGLQVGDLIIDYTNVYDIVMSHHGSVENYWKNKAKWGCKLQVLRGDQIVNLEVAEQKP